jgi:hypothetical protein
VRRCSARGGHLSDPVFPDSRRALASETTASPCTSIAGDCRPAPLQLAAPSFSVTFSYAPLSAVAQACRAVALRDAASRSASGVQSIKPQRSACQSDQHAGHGAATQP